MTRIVVIDDEYVVVEGIKALLSRRQDQYQVAGWAYDGIEGLSVVRSLQPDIVITDIRIPGMDGLSLIETAKDFCPDTFFVVISGYTEFEYARKALSLGVKGYIDKPVSREKLEDVLGRIEEERRLLQNERIRSESEREEALRRKQQYEDLERLEEKSIQGLTRSDTGLFLESSRKVLEKLGDLYPETADLRRECYKYLCLAGDILMEEQPRTDREELASFRDLEKQETVPEILEYGEKILQNISRYMKAHQTGSSHRAILEVLNYIENHYQEDIGLNELAVHARMSTAYLSVLFKAEVGESFIKYLTELRLKKAKSLLKEGYKVKEVSEMVGYNNYRYFCDIFKKNVGQTPHEYKESVWTL